MRIDAQGRGTAGRSGRRWLGALLVGAVGLGLAGCGDDAAAPQAGPIVITTESTRPGPLVVWSETPTAPPSSAGAAATHVGPPKTGVATPTPAPASRPSAVQKKRSGPAAGTVLAQLATLPVKGRAPKTGYERSNFGSGWKDPDHNGCDGRNDILRRDLTAIVARPGTQGCIITSGILKDPYTGTLINFVRGQGTSNAVQIDHVVALSDAWQKGAQQLGADQRIALANDPLNLLAVDGPANASKGDGDAATWLPPRKSFRCAYVARQTAVKAKYGLWVTQAEHDAISRIITTQCPGQKVQR